MRSFFSIILFIALILQINVCGQVSQAYEVGKEPHDKVLISGGKPVFVIAISPNLASDSFVTEREKKELQKNFKSLQADVRIEYTDVIIFKNKNIRKWKILKSSL